MIRTSVSIGGSRISDNDFSRISIKQSIGRHHSFEIRLRQDAKKGELMEKTNSWMGKSVQIGIDDKEDTQIVSSPVPDIFKGIVTSVGLSRQSGTSELIVKGESPTILFDDGPNTRSFTDKVLQEVIDEVFRPYISGFPSSPKVEPKIKKESLPYIVQYNETNFAFSVRLADKFGEWFYYDGLELYFGRPDAGKPIPLDFEENGLTFFDISVKAIPTNFETKAYNYKIHKQLSETPPEKAKSNELGKKVLNISSSDIFNQSLSTSEQIEMEEKDLKELVKRREQINVDEMVILTGASKNSKLKLGAKIDIKDKLTGESFGAYIITELMHDIGQGGGYFNSFEAIPVEVETPPLKLLPNPPFCETQLAKVTNVNDEDSLGRVKVKFLWQEGGSEESPWLRVASPYSGKDKGFYIIPEVDDQVLVAFESNNPDKPYVLTGMYNGEAKPQWFDPKNHFKGFMSKAQSQWKFDDKDESILISAPNSITLSAGNTITIETGGKKDSEININVGEGTINVTAKVVNVKATETIKMESEKEILAKANQTVKIESGKELAASGAQKVEIKGAQVLVEGSAKSELKGAMVDVSGTGPVNVKGTPIKLN